jgi:hypothetical protein
LLRKSHVGSLIGLGAMVHAITAGAHAPPEVRRIAWGNGSEVVLLANRGVLFGDTATGEWTLLCNEALDITVYEKPDLVVTPDGSVLLGTSVGLQRTRDKGCSLARVAPIGEILVPALAQDPTRPDLLYLSTFSAGESAIRITEDGATTFRVLLALPDNDYVRSLRVAVSQPNRVYAAGSTFDHDAGYRHYVARSDDGGRTWSRFDTAVHASELDVTLLAVSPEDSDIVLAKATSVEPSQFPERLFVSRDGGASFSSTVAIENLNDAAFGSDGTVWIAGSEGLWRSTDGASTFARFGEATHSTCVVTRGSDLFACGYFGGENAYFAKRMDGVGVYDEGTSSFAPWMTLNRVSGVVACSGAPRTTSICREPWFDWQAEVPSHPVVERGTPDAGPPTPSQRSDGAGCDCRLSVAPNRASVPIVVLGLISAIRRRFRSPRGPSRQP